MKNGHNVEALKSGVWYTASNFFMKALVFLTTPIFTRMLSQEEFGVYNNFISWLTTLSVFITLTLESTFISARYKFEDDFDGYVSSMVGFSTLSALVWLIVVNVFYNYSEDITGLRMLYINIMIVYLLFSAVINQFQTQERYYFKYKTSVFTSLIISVGSTIMSVVLVCILGDKLLGRILGYTIIPCMIGAFLLIYLIKKGRKISLQYWKYALPICIPFIPHLLSLSILNSVDKIMITQMCGAIDTALYSVAYTCGAIVSVLVISINTAFAPWLGEKLNEEKFDEIKKFSGVYVGGFCFLACGVMVVAPELLYILGGEGYSEAIYVMPPVAFGFVCQFVYTMYVNIEQFKRRTIGMAFASIMAASINYFLNLLLIPQYGYIIAAYTTLISFFFLMIMHMFFVYRLGYARVYNAKMIFLSIGVVAIFTYFVNWLYVDNTIRLLFISIYSLVFIIFIYNVRGHLQKIIKY